MKTDNHYHRLRIVKVTICVGPVLKGIEIDFVLPPKLDFATQVLRAFFLKPGVKKKQNKW